MFETTDKPTPYTMPRDLPARLYMYDTPLKAMTHKGKVVFYDMEPFLFYSKRMLEGLRAAGFGWVASSEALVRERYAVQAIPTVDTKG